MATTVPASTGTPTADLPEPARPETTGGPRATGGMVPPRELLPDALPTERLSETGRPLPPLRDELRRIPDLRNALNVASVWLQSVGMLAVALWIGHPIAYVVAFVLMGRGFALFAILAHEAAHRLLFSNKHVNDVVGRWLLAYPAFVPLDLYRRSHMAHHKDEFGPNEPDMDLYSGYPITRASFRRKLRRDATGVSGWKNLKPLLRAAGQARSRPLALRIIGTQLVIAAGLTALGMWLAGAWWVYPVLWLAPWMTIWRVINRLRSIAEHGGMQRSADRRETTHHVDQHLFARFWMVPFNTGWHLAHHIDAGVPFRNLPALHRELVDAGWVTPEITHPSYRALFRALSSA